ncbi:MAG: tRNA (adenosine(37)-N6)-dimethylallyltransferase MiaA [Deltaproteobacteria bacterium]|nr:tRNA (adenosine(37)-N6)-dimethylallyltransferase MiaA [Deltaproteobacteria bacterium]
MKTGRHNLIVILGPTASGKTRVAAMLAREIGSEIISADSRQVYRGMDLGTGKDISEFVVDDMVIPHHLIDIVDADYEFNLFEYQKMFYRSFSEISERGIIPIMVGGTGLYIEAVVRGYRMHEVPENSSLRGELRKMDMDAMRDRLLQNNPAVHNTTDTQDRDRLIRAIEIVEHSKEHGFVEEVERPRIAPFIIGIRWERSVLRERITRRLKERIDMGMIEEVKDLHNQGVSWARLDSFGLEYRYVSRYLQGEMDFDEMFSQLGTRIHQFSKRQMTWFRRMEKRGIVIRWIDNAEYDSIKRLIEEHVG